MSSGTDYSIRTTAVTLEILAGLRELDGAGVSELATHLDLTKSSVYNHLNTLRDHEYVVKEGNRYRLSFRFLELGGYTRDRLPFFTIAEAELRKLSDESGEKANLLVEENGRGVYLFFSKGEQAVDVDSYVGMRTYLHTTALGKAILAHLPRERVDEIIARHGLPGVGPNTITSVDELLDELELIRERGFALDDEERLPGLRCVAAPIRSSEGEVYGSISLSGPMSRMADDRFTDEIPEMILRTANLIELTVTHS